MTVHVDWELSLSDIPRECIEDCTVGGQDASEPVKHWRQRLAFTVNRTKALKCLKGYGAWEPEELAAQSDDDIAEKILWLACGDFREYLYEAEREGVDPLNPGEFQPNSGSDIFCLE